MGRHAVPTEVSFWRHVEKEGNASGCWLWNGYRQANGHGLIKLSKLDGNGTRCAARYAYELYNGEFDPILVVTQVCENRACVRPDHLALVTRKQATAGNGKSKAPKTHCPQGHRYLQAGEYKRNGPPVCALCKSLETKVQTLRKRSTVELP